MIDSHNLPEACFIGQPVQRRVSEVHLPLARLCIFLHPIDYIFQVLSVKRVNNNPTQSYPRKQLKPLRHSQQIAGLNNARPGGEQTQARGGQVRYQIVVVSMVLVGR